MTLYPQTTCFLKNTTGLINQFAFCNATAIEPEDEERICRHKDRSSDDEA